MRGPHNSSQKALTVTECVKHMHTIVIPIINARNPKGNIQAYHRFLSHSCLHALVMVMINLQAKNRNVFLPLEWGERKDYCNFDLLNHCQMLLLHLQFLFIQSSLYLYVCIWEKMLILVCITDQIYLCYLHMQTFWFWEYSLCVKVTADATIITGDL